MAGEKLPVQLDSTEGYVLVRGHRRHTRGRDNPGVYDRWTEVLQQLKNYPKHPWFKGFHKLEEALDYARRNLGPNFFITPALRLPVSKIRDTTSFKDALIKCDQCDTTSSRIAEI